MAGELIRPGGIDHRSTPVVPERYSIYPRIKDNHDEIVKRLKVVKEYTESQGLTPPQEFANEQHYWYLVYKSSVNNYRLFARYFPEIPKERRKKAAAAKGMDDAQTLITEEQNALTDKLTGAYSRAALDNFLDRLSQSSEQENAVHILDIDRFKAINDQQGHIAGDKILQRFSIEVQRHLSDLDMFARYGGEEFAIVQPHTTVDRAVSLAEKVRKGVEGLGVTVSIGLTLMDGSEPSVKEVLKAADLGLYGAKESGRNSTGIYTGRDPKGRLSCYNITQRRFVTVDKTMNQ